MKKRLPDSTRIHHALKAANRLASRFDGATLTAFLFGEDLQDIVPRQFMIIGEAANHVSNELKARHPDVDWKQVVRFRNFVVHEYFKVDLAIVWDTATYVVPALITQLEAALVDAQQEEAGNQSV